METLNLLVEGINRHYDPLDSFIMTEDQFQEVNALYHQRVTHYIEKDDLVSKIWHCFTPLFNIGRTSIEEAAFDSLNCIEEEIAPAVTKFTNDQMEKFGKQIRYIHLTVINEVLAHPTLHYNFKKLFLKGQARLIELITDLNADMVPATIKQQLRVLTSKIAELECLETSTSIMYHYWPLKSITIARAMDLLLHYDFVEDIALVEDILKNFNNETGALIEWKGGQRDLIFFLYHVYGHSHNGETIFDIAIKLFNWKQKKGKNKSFSSELSLFFSQKIYGATTTKRGQILECLSKLDQG
jgi:hypothetical protein